MKRYPEYKDSGVPWLGKVPAHWEVTPAYILASTTKRAVSVSKLKGLKVAHYSIPNVQEFGAAQIEDGDSIDSSKVLVEGPCVLVSRLNPRKRTVISADIHPDAGLTVCSGEFIKFCSKNADTLEWLERFYISDAAASFIESLVMSATKSHGRADPHVVKRMQVGVPPPAELKRLVAALRKQVEVIDAAISSQARMIDLLKERRSAIIAQAVTKGLDSKAKMKDSGVPWLGQVPAHWQIRKLKTLSSGIRGGDWGDEPVGDSNDMYCIRAADLVTELQSIDQSTLVLRNYPRGITKTRILSPGDIIIEKSGGGDLVPVGRTAMVTDGPTATFSNFMGAIKPSHGVFSGFLSLLYYVIHDTGQVLRSIKQTTGIQNLDSQMLMSENIALPPFHEQIEIYEYVVHVRKQIEQAEQSMQSLICLMKERRSAIITQAVTGQIDVR